MPELPELRAADCGHGMVPADAVPNARIHDNGPYGFREGVVCAACLEASRAFQRPRVETKSMTIETGAALPSRVATEGGEFPIEFFKEHGRRLAAEGVRWSAPTGFHGRSVPARASKAAYEEARQTGVDGKPTDRG